MSDLVNQNSSVLKLTNNNILTLSRTDIDDLGIKHYQYRQHYNNVKVEDSQFYIHTSQNDIPISANGELSYSLNINTTPSISSTQAIATAINYANATKYYWQDTARENLLKEATNNLDTSYYPNAELVIINLNASQGSLLPNYTANGIDLCNNYTENGIN